VSSFELIAELALQRYKVKKLEDELAMRDWISVKEREPRLMETVLVVTQSSDIIMAQLDSDWDGKPEWIDTTGGILDEEIGMAVTHWMPMPEAPKEKELQIHKLRVGEPCSHRGCLNHISHPCEGCGRIAGGLMDKPETPREEG
jgi:hypothetical protein